MASTRPRPQVTGRIRLYVAAVAVAALLLAPLSRASDGLTDGPVAVFDAVVLAALIAGTHRYPVQLGPRRRVNVGTVPEVAAVLLAPGPLAVATLAAGTLAGELWVRGRVIQHLFNTSVAVMRAVVGTVIIAALQAVLPAPASEPVAFILAITAMYVSTTLLVLGISAVQLRENPLRRSRMPERRVLGLEAILSLTGVLAALAIAGHAWALPLLVAPAAVAYRAVRDGVALHVQTRVAQEAVREAEAALAAREEFLTMAAHEFRTPLTALRTYIELAQRRLRRGAKPEETDLALVDAVSQIQRLSGLVAEMLDLAEVDAAQLQVQRSPAPLAPLVQRVVELARALEPGREIRLTLPPVSPVIPADTRRIEQVLANLLENAAKYSAVGAPIDVELTATAEAVEIHVRDAGIGIPPEDLPRIFERFQRAGNVDQNNAGLGLGLYISRALVEGHGGRISVDSTLGQGSTFTVSLPLADAGAADPPGYAEQRPA